MVFFLEHKSKHPKTILKMKTFLMILAFVAIFVTFGEAAPPCTDKHGKPCTGCLFTSGDMEGKCKMSGKYSPKNNQGYETCVGEPGGKWCA